MEKRTALITGSSRGIGRGIALKLAKQGYNIVLNYKENDEAARSASCEIGELSRVITVKADVSCAAEVDRLYIESIKNFGFVDTVINNAGVAFGGLLIDTDDAYFDEIMDTNLKGAFNMCRRFLPDMLSNGFGRIVNISSIWGITGAAYEAIYSASKAALIGLTKALSKEVATMGVTVNAVAPGAIDTDMLRKLGDETLEKLKENIMVGRLGTPSDVAAAVEFLCSKSAEYISGQTLGINGEYVNSID